MFSYTPYMVPPLFSSAVCGVLAVYAHRMRRLPTAGPVFWLMFSLSVWALAYALNTAATAIPPKVFFTKIGSTCTQMTGLSILAISLEASGRGAWLTRRRFVYLSILPVACLLLVWTMEYHTAFWHGFYLIRYGSLRVLGYQGGPGFVVQVLYVYLMNAAAVVIFAVALWRAAPAERVRFVLLILATALPLASYSLGPTPVKGLSTLTWTFWFTGTCYTVAIVRYRMLDLVPVARGALFEVMAEPVLIIDRDGIVADANRAARDLLGLPRRGPAIPVSEALEGHDELASLIGQGTTPQEGTAITEAVTGRTWHVTFSAIHASGAQREGRLVVLRDITALIRAEEALRRSEELFRLMVASSSDIFELVDADGRLKYASPAAERITGYTPEELMRPVTEIVHPDDREKLAGALLEARNTPGKIVSWEYRHGHRTRGYVWVEAVGASHLHDPTIQAVVVSTRDVSERKLTEEIRRRAQEEAEKANAAKTRFLSVMSHEMRTPLHAMMGAAELLRGTPLDESQRKYVQLFGRSGATLRQLLDDALDFSLIEAGRLELADDAVHLDGLLEDLRALFEEPYARKGLSFAARREENLPGAVRADRRRLLQVLTNLVGNACKYTDRGGAEVVLGRSIAAGGPFFEMRVSDTGVGIAPERAATIFEPFSRKGNVSGKAREGTGLGLSITKRLVDLMGGRIEVVSRAGGGTIFTISLPFRAAEPGAAADETAAQPRVEAALSGLRILAVDDVPENLELLRYYLEGNAVEVVEAATGEEALARFGSCRFDCVLLDIQLPDLKGTDVARAIRETERGEGRERTPIIGISADAYAESAKAALEGGCDEYLTRPVDRGGLLGALNRLAGGAVTGAPGADPRGDGASALLPQVRARIVACVAEIGEASRSGDAALAARLGHSIKGLGMTFGLADAERIGHEIQRVAEEGDLEKARGLCTELLARIEGDWPGLPRPEHGGRTPPPGPGELEGSR